MGPPLLGTCKNSGASGPSQARPMGQSGALCHLNSGEATTILASCGSKGYSAMMFPTCRRGAAAREAVQSDHGMGLS